MKSATKNHSLNIEVTASNQAAVEYLGADVDLIDAEIIEADWLVGLGRHARQLVKLPDGGFQVIGEGKGNRITYAHRRNGAFSIKRLTSGMLVVVAYRKPEDRQSFIDEQREVAKPDRRSSVEDVIQTYLDAAESLIDGSAYLPGVPGIELDNVDIERAQDAFRYLRDVLAWSRVKSASNISISPNEN